MGWMIRNDGSMFETAVRVVLEEENETRNDPVSLIWLYEHTGCILTRYSVLRLLVLMAEKANSYIMPSEYFRGLAALGEQFKPMRTWLADHAGLLNDIDREFRKQDESIAERDHLPPEYDEEMLFRRKTLSYQLQQEFIFAEEYSKDIKGEESRYLDIENDSILFDWSDVISRVLEILGPEHMTRINRFGRGYVSLDRLSGMSGRGAKERRLLGKPDEQLKAGKSVLQIINNDSYCQDFVLLRFEWIRWREIDYALKRR